MSTFTRKHIAYHEAGHAAANLLLDHNPSIATIAPRGDTLGRVEQLDGDMFSVEGVTNLIVALYAGAEAQKLYEPKVDLLTVALGAHSDDEEADEYLRLLDCDEASLHAHASELLQANWSLVERIAAELMAHVTLNGDELDILLDIHRGDATDEDLTHYRAISARARARPLSTGRQR
ncbi:MAG TPA: hypothetical protein ENI99_04000 [Sedimenticola sp.]|nr:hypothetical protein [Sedimenticola sp.]